MPLGNPIYMGFLEYASGPYGLMNGLYAETAAWIRRHTVPRRALKVTTKNAAIAIRGHPPTIPFLDFWRGEPDDESTFAVD